MHSRSKTVTCPSCSFPAAEGVDHPDRRGILQRLRCGMCGYAVLRHSRGDSLREEATPGLGVYEIIFKDLSGEDGRFTERVSARYVAERVANWPDHVLRAWFTEQGEDGVWRRVYLAGSPVEGDPVDSLGTGLVRGGGDEM